MLVGVFQCLRHPGNDLGGLAERGTAGGQTVCQGYPLDEFGDEIRHPVELANLVYWYDPRVPKLRGTASFAEEALEILGAGQVAGAGNLERYDAIETGVSGLVD
jgi:hypothetical protein